MLCNCSSRQSNGFTLIEVVASLLLVGTLLVAVLMAHRRTAHQTRLAQNRLAAVTALDQLLTWRVSPNPEFPEAQQPSGKIPGENPFHWRTEARTDLKLKPWGAMLLRLEVFDPEFEEGRTLASVELLAPGDSS